MEQPVSVAGPIRLDEVETIDRLRVALDSISYTGEGIRRLLGDDAYHARQREVPVHLRRLRAGTPLETAVKLFFLGVPVPRREVELALEPLRVEELRRLGVLDASDDPLRATVRLAPHAELLLAGNRYPDETPGGAPADYVATATAPSAILASLTVRRPARTGLDIGTGSGVQALWAARHCERVVAVDVNPRALNLAAFNARLNALANIEFREGSLFEPVAGERFDLIVCNAPYVVSPDARCAYRDSGLPSDRFCERLVREMPSHLEEGGFAHLLIGWILAERDWAGRPRSWLEDSGCDCWLLLGVQRDPVTHAAVWNQDLTEDPSSYADTLDRWIRHLGELGAEAVMEGAALIRRRSGARNWFRADRIPPGRPDLASDHVQRVFGAQDDLTELADETALLDETLRLADRLRFEQRLVCRDGGYVVESMTVVLEEGLGFRAGIDQNTATLVPLLDGTRSLREAIAEAARARRLHDSDLEAFTSGAVRVVREMFELGFVVRGRGSRSQAD
jgi:hypothetical protein